MDPWMKFFSTWERLASRKTSQTQKATTTWNLQGPLKRNSCNYLLLKAHHSQITNGRISPPLHKHATHPYICRMWPTKAPSISIQSTPLSRASVTGPHWISSSHPNSTARERHLSFWPVSTISMQVIAPSLIRTISCAPIFNHTRSVPPRTMIRRWNFGASPNHRRRDWILLARMCPINKHLNMVTNWGCKQIKIDPVLHQYNLQWTQLLSHDTCIICLISPSDPSI